MTIARLTHKVDPSARQVSKSGKIRRCRKPLRLEAAHLARRSRSARSRFAADNPAHRGIVTQTFSVVDVFVSGKATKYRLPEQPRQCVPTILAGTYIGKNITRHRRKSENVVEFTISQQSSIRGHHGAAKLEH
jgi:hypothetical protein